MFSIPGGYDMLHADLYKVFYYVATYKNITHAANQLFTTQPAVSKSIKKLESLTNCTLFVRSQKGVTLTSEGELLFEYVQKAFNYLISGEKMIEKINNKEEGVVKIGISNTLCKYFFFPHLEKFHQSYPNISIQIMNQSSPNTFALLDECSIDFGIISIPKNKPNYNYIGLMTVHDIFVTKSPNLQEQYPLEILAKHPLMLLDKENQTRIYIDDFLKRNGLELRPEIEIGSMDFLVELAKIGIGTACVIREFVQAELSSGTLYEISITPSPMPRKIGIVHKSQVPLSIAAKTFVEFLKTH